MGRKRKGTSFPKGNAKFPCENDRKQSARSRSLESKKLNTPERTNGKKRNKTKELTSPSVTRRIILNSTVQSGSNNAKPINQDDIESQVEQIENSEDSFFNDRVIVNVDPAEEAEFIDDPTEEDSEAELNTVEFNSD